MIDRATLCLTRQRLVAFLAATSLVAMGCGNNSEVDAETAEIEAVVDSALVALYSGGLTYEAFLDDSDERVDQWRTQEATLEVPADLLARGQAIAGRFRLLAVAEDWCGDSLATIPYLARLAALVEGLDLRVVNADDGAAVMASRPTPDGRPATPTVVILDEAGSEVGCFVERPSSLQTWFLANVDGLEEDDLSAAKSEWYKENAGRDALTQVIEVMESVEATATGSGACSELVATDVEAEAEHS